MRSIFAIVFIFISSLVFSQENIFVSDTVGSKTISDNLYNRAAFGDSLASSFCILIKKEVKLHKHLNHSEHVMVLEGEGMMRLGEKKFKIKKGDLVFIPKNTIHSVKTTSTYPLKVYSIQSPAFDGKDRIMIEEK